MIVDIHTHVFPPAIVEKALTKLSQSAHVPYYTNGMISGLSESMIKNKVDVSIVQPVVTNPKHTRDMNEIAVETTEQFENTGILSFGGIHPDNTDYVDVLKGLVKNGVKGIKLHPVFQDVDIDDQRYLRIIDKASELGLIMLMHAGYDISCPGKREAAVSKIKNMLDAVHPENFILAHMGGFGEWEEVPEMLAKHNVYIDMAASLQGMDVKVANEVIAAQPVERILYGSDSPWTDQGESLKVCERYFKGEAYGKVVGENARKLLGL